MNNEDKIRLVLAKLDNIHGDKISYINNSEKFKEKYVLSEVLSECNSIKLALIEELELLGGSWSEPID